METYILIVASWYPDYCVKPVWTVKIFTYFIIFNLFLIYKYMYVFPIIKKFDRFIN